MTMPTTRELLSAGCISQLDHHFGLFMARLSASDLDPADLAVLAAASAMVSAYTGGGHTCLPLSELVGSVAQRGREAPLAEKEAGPCWPEKVDWAAILGRCAVVGDGSDLTPLVLDDAGRLYLHRYFAHEQRLGRLLQERIEAAPAVVDGDWLGEALERLFPGEPGDSDPAGEVDWRKLAGLVVASRKLAIISGGPGTGKTTAVIKLLALLIEQAQRDGRDLRIALVAPTGKAAARLQETVDKQRAKLPISDEVRAGLPEESTTLHRRLGYFGTGYRYGPDNRVPYDVVVVDEASMVDMGLMSTLLAALEDDATLVLLGDRHQLASVQPGAVLGDLCRIAAAQGYSQDLAHRFQAVTGGVLTAEEVNAGDTGIGDCTVQLRRNYRFDDQGGIGLVAAAIVAGEGEQTLKALETDASAIVVLVEPADPADVPGLVSDRAIKAYRAYLGADSIEAAFSAFLSYRILCAHRRGRSGAVQINRAIEAALFGAGLCHGRSEWYRGRPVMVTRNDHALRLYNGDVGLAWPDEQGVMLVMFPDGQGGFRTFQPTRLPEHETVYAMTVHKSQGSEFGRVLLVLPEETSRVLTRELIYTGVTRAKDGVEIIGVRSVLVEGVQARVERWSALGGAVGV